jgi:predicted permease
VIRLPQRVKLRLRSLLQGARSDRELDDELQYHLECQIQFGISSGLSPQEARAAALREMGAVTQNKELCRDQRGLNYLVAVKRNLRFGLRMLARSPVFTAVALLTLALGIGANTALFSVVDAVLLRPMPFRDPDRLAVILARDTRPSARDNVLRGAAGARETGLSIADLKDFREQAHTFSDFAAATGFAANLTGSNDPIRIDGESVTPNYFSLLGVAPVLGRDFLKSDDALKGERSVILSHEFWVRYWLSDPRVVGQTVSLDQVPYCIAGVLPAGFRTPLGRTADLFRALIPAADPARRGQRFWSVIGRLRAPNVEAARAEMSAIAGRLAGRYPASNRGIDVAVRTFPELIPGPVRSGLTVLMFSVALLLFIACFNIANLLLIRTAGREREIATRKALGASGSQIFHQFLAENLLLAMLGGMLGLPLANWLIHLIAGVSVEVPRAEQSHLDWRVLAFTFAVTLLSGLFFTLLPLVRAVRRDAAASLVNRSGGPDRRSQRLSSALVVMQIAMAVMLLIESGLMLRSFEKLQSVQPGFRGAGVISFQVSMSRAQFRSTEQSAALFAELTDRIRAVPGVENAGATLQLPIAGLDVDLTKLGIPEQPVKPDDEPSVRLHVVTPGYFATLGVPLLRGRFFTDADGPSSQGVAVVNEAMAHGIWGAEDPIGKRIAQRLTFTPGEKPDRVVVGIVGNVKHFGLEFEDEPQMYVPHRQSPWPAMYFVVQTSLSQGAIERGLQQAVWSVDRGLPVDKMSAMEDVLHRSLNQPRVRAVVITAFGATAILLALIGTYGVVSYRVARRHKELAIRLALGADRGDVTRLIVGDGAILALVGVTAGVVGARLAAPAVAGLLYGVPPTHAGILISSAGVGFVAAVLASLLPAIRATRVEPMETLRLE